MKLIRTTFYALLLTCIIVTTANAQDTTESYTFTDSSTDFNYAEQSDDGRGNIRNAPPYLLNDNFIVTLVKLNWYAAYAFCEQNNWNLLRIETPMQQFDVQTYLNFFNLQGNDFWIAGNNFVDLRNFRWDYDGPSFSYTNWAFGQPDNYKGGEHCVKMHKNSLQWGDDSCENTYHFICQIRNTTNTIPSTPVYH